MTPGHRSCPGQFKRAKKAGRDFRKCPMLCEWLGQIEHASVASRILKASNILQYVAVEMRPGDFKYWTRATAAQSQAVSQAGNADAMAVPVADDVMHTGRIQLHEQSTLGNSDMAPLRFDTADVQFLELYQVRDLMQQLDSDPPERRRGVRYA